MTPEQLKAKFPHASDAFIRANLQAQDPGPVAKLESDPCNAPLAKSEVQESDPGRFLVCVESVRKRLLDEDGLCEKYHVDCLRYASILHDDNPGAAKIEVSQRKAEKGEEEHINITVYPRAMR